MAMNDSVRDKGRPERPRYLGGMVGDQSNGLNDSPVALLQQGNNKIENEISSGYKHVKALPRENRGRRQWRRGRLEHAVRRPQELELELELELQIADWNLAGTSLI